MLAHQCCYSYRTYVCGVCCSFTYICIVLSEGSLHCISIYILSVLLLLLLLFCRFGRLNFDWPAGVWILWPMLPQPSTTLSTHTLTLTIYAHAAAYTSICETNERKRIIIQWDTISFGVPHIWAALPFDSATTELEQKQAYWSDSGTERQFTHNNINSISISSSNNNNRAKKKEDKHAERTFVRKCVLDWRGKHSIM